MLSPWRLPTLALQRRRPRCCAPSSPRRWLTHGSHVHTGVARLSGQYYQGVLGGSIDLVVASLPAGGCATAALKA